MRRIVICLDGTWNNAERGIHVEGGRTRYRPTNVLKTYRAVLPMAADGVDQISYYSEGVGAMIDEPTRLGGMQRFMDRVVGGAFAGGFEARVKSAYRFLVGNYREGDEIFVFGFSRGAAQAQSLVRFVEWTGGVLHKGDEYYIPELYARFRSSGAAAGEAALAFAEIRGRSDRPNPVRDPRPAEVRFLGLYDTVFSLGSRLIADRDEGAVKTVARRYGFHIGETPTTIVRDARQALAIDEARLDYRPQVWRRAAPGRAVVQLWFPGVHTNVGGGRRSDGLANGALRWMIDEAKSVGLGVDETYLASFGAGVRDERPLRRSFGSRLNETLRLRRGEGVRDLDAGPEAGTGVHASALRLLIEDPRYRPANLLAYLAQHPEALASLSPQERERIAALLPRRPGE